MKKRFFGSSFGILGDSYATFQGWILPGNACYYPKPEKVEDVLQVEQTWWHQLMVRNDLRLLVNDSCSGATVCTHVRPSLPFSSAFTERVKRSFTGQYQPDYIFLFGGTNDSWLDRTIGQVNFSCRTEADLQQVLPAYCQVLETLTEHNPQSVVVSVVNTDLHPQIHEGILCANAHYGAVSVVLSEIHKQNKHPSALGMRQIAEQIEAVLLALE